MTVTFEHDLAPVAYPDGERCAFCGRPGSEGEVREPCDDEVATGAGYVGRLLAAPLRPCCGRHDLAMCDPCRDLPRSTEHRDPREAS